MHAIGILILIWGSLWSSAVIGSRVGNYIYNDRYAPPPPYTAEQIASMRQVSPEAARLAERDVEVWRETVELGTSLAGVEGALAGTVAILAVWLTVGLVWMWNRERRRRLEQELRWDADGEGIELSEV